MPLQFLIAGVRLPLHAFLGQIASLIGSDRVGGHASFQLREHKKDEQCSANYHGRRFSLDQYEHNPNPFEGGHCQILKRYTKK